MEQIKIKDKKDKKQFINWLIDELTKNPEFENYIIQIINNQSSGNSQEVENLKNQLRNIQKESESEISVLKKNLKKKDSQISELEHKLEPFEDSVKFLGMFRNLSSSVKRGLGNVINDTDAVTFIASCSDEKNLNSIWKYASDISDDYNSNDFTTLCEIFDYFFEVFNKSKNKYKRDDVKIGDDFDEDFHNRYTGSQTSGTVKEVILRGYSSVNTNKIICKSIVKV